jgi:hypothetical protein
MLPRFHILDMPVYPSVPVTLFTVRCMLSCAYLNFRDGSDQEQAFRASRVSGERSIQVALAEIQIIKHNVYVQRKERTLPEVCLSAGRVHPVASCKDDTSPFPMQRGVNPCYCMADNC